MKPFRKVANKPGRIVLHAGIAAYSLALLAAIVGLNLSPENATSAIVLLLLLPFFAPLFALMLFPTVFFVGIVTGTPVISFSHAFAMAKLYWRGISGAVLLFAVLFTVILMSFVWL